MFVAFAGSMLGLVTADDMLLLFVFWELTTVISYLLIGHYADRKASRRAAMQAIVITTAGGLAMLVGIVLLGEAAGTYRLSEVIADPPQGTTAVTVAIVCLLAGAVTKSALIPFHFWLPAAMAAPTPGERVPARRGDGEGRRLPGRPVRAGVLARPPAWQWIVVVLGCGTLLLGGYRALRQHDLKLVLAFGTVSQLGLIVLLVGLGTRATALAGLAMLGAHAMFKAALFLVVGVVDAATGTRDLRRLSGVGRELPADRARGRAGDRLDDRAAAVRGLRRQGGRRSRRSGTTTHRSGRSCWSRWPSGRSSRSRTGCGCCGARSRRSPPWSRRPVEPESTAPGTSIHEAAHDEAEPARITHPSLLLVWPAMILAVLGLAVALLPQLGEHLLAPYADTYPEGEPGHLVLWAGLTPTFVLTLGDPAGRRAAVLVRDRVERWQRRRTTDPRRTGSTGGSCAGSTTSRPTSPRSPSAVRCPSTSARSSSCSSWRSAATALVAARVSRRSVTVVGQPRAGGVRGRLVIVVRAAGTRARRRLKAVILLGIGGYAVAGLFLLHGAPDLALTQVLVETVTLVVFVLVLRRLPPYFSDRPLAASRWVRLAIGVAVGLTVGGDRARRARRPDPPARSPRTSRRRPSRFGGGKNIVNVTLVDIRAWDTMGEISVLLVAATGVASLVFLSRRGGAIYRADEARTRPRRLGRRARTPWRRCAGPGGDSAAVDAGGMVADRDESAVPSSAPAAASGCRPAGRSRRSGGR